MSDIIKEWGVKLLSTKIRLAGSPIGFFKQVQINPWRLSENAVSGLKVYKDVLWMRLFEMDEGIRLPNGCKFFAYIPFWGDIFPNGKKFYRFKKPNKEVDVWEYHSYGGETE